VFDISLRRLHTDHIDPYYAHRWDDATPIEETLRALDDLVRLGKVCYVGASEYALWQLAHANLLAEVRGWTPFVALQSRYNMLERQVEGEVLPYCRAYGVGLIPYYPLAGGFLTGKYRRGEPPPAGSRGATDSRMQRYMTGPNYDAVEALTAWSGARGRKLNELAQSWLLAQPQVCSVISGATSLEHVLHNAKAASWRPSGTELAEVNALLEQHRAQR
jgi:aryl-alcohol dehydrogenase-like predicted oxidoreductase